MSRIGTKLPVEIVRAIERGVVDVGWSADRLIAALARVQHGVVARAQLLELGLTPKQIKARVRVERLHPLHRGVYLVGHDAAAPGASQIAAVLAAGAAAQISHLSGLQLWRLPGPAPDLIDVTVPADRTLTRPGIRFHRTDALTPRDTRRVERIPVTSPARTLLDVAALLSSTALERALGEAIARRLVRRSDLRDQLERNPGRPGTPSLRALVRGATPAWTRSEAEAELLALLRAADLPLPAANQKLGRYEPDLLWREQRVIVEFDSWQWHSSRRAFEADRRRDADLAARGYTVIRVTWRQLATEPHAVVARIAAALARAEAK